MAKSESRKEGNSGETRTDVKGHDPNYDPALASLFAQSVSKLQRPVLVVLTLFQLGPMKTTIRPDPRLESHSTNTSAPKASSSLSHAGTEESGPLSEKSTEQVQIDFSGFKNSRPLTLSNDTAKVSSRKRKRKDAEDDLESKYMSKMASEDTKEDQIRAQALHNERQKPNTRELSNGDSGSADEAGEYTSCADLMTDSEEEPDVRGVPQRSVASREDLDLEKSSRTVFLANVSTKAIKSKKGKRTLMDHLASFISSLPAKNGGHGVESLRFRSTPFAASGIPKKAAFAKREIMDATTKSTNAYVVYTSQLAAREAATRLNGSTVLGRHLRVDLVAHPAKTDHRRCVFVGNLGFVDDETNINAAEDEANDKQPRKAKEPADIEEGLWRQFQKAGIVESVRVVRDKT